VSDELVRRYRASTNAPATARRDITEYLRAWPQDLVDVVALLVSELVTNSVLYTGDDVHVRACWAGSSIRIEVSDSSTSMPRMRDADVNGYGLHLVHQLSKRWGSERHNEGKTTWFEVTANGSPERSRA
jgi:anti-sigma regulatory factor (Ser/Thr protein kinase)